MLLSVNNKRDYKIRVFKGQLTLLIYFAHSEIKHMKHDKMSFMCVSVLSIGKS